MKLPAAQVRMCAGTDPLAQGAVAAHMQLAGQAAPQWTVMLQMFPGGHIVAVALAPACEALDEVRCLLQCCLRRRASMCIGAGCFDQTKITAFV